MEGVLGILQSVSSRNRDDINVFLKAFNEHQCFQKTTSGRNEFVSHITGLLSNSTTRFEGLLLLEELLKQCSLDILEQKGALWAGLCIKTCSQKNIFACVPMACRALGMLIEKTKEIPELSKAFTNHLLGNFFDSLKNTPSNASVAVLECVEISLCIYPNACGPHRGAIEKYVTSFIENSNISTVKAAAKCLHLLQQVRGGNTVGISFQQTWQKYQLCLLGGLHETLDNIFSDCPEIYYNSEQFEKWNIPVTKLSDNPVRRASQLLNRYKNRITFLILALTEPYSVPKLIMPGKILNFIQRGLAINCTILGKRPTANNLAIGALLPEIQIELFTLLDVLISTLKSNMALYVHAFLSCVLDTLKWTNSGKSAGFTKSYSGLRIAAYNSLSLWNATFKHGSCCELIAEYLIEQINGDITPFENEVTLKVLGGSKKHMSKKARRLLHKTQNEQSNIAQTHSKTFNPVNTKAMYSDEGNQNLCAAALNCLTSIIQSASCVLKPVIIKDVLDTIFSIAVHVLNCDDGVKVQLYSGNACRLNLYGAIYATITDPNHLCPPPIQFVIEILTTAQVKDRNQTVRSTCSQYLRAIEKIAHPQKDSIFYPVDKNDVRIALRNRSFRDNEMSEEEDVEPTKNTRESPEFDDEITEEIDLTENQDENDEPPDHFQNELNDEDVVEQIYLDSSSDDKSPDVMEVDPENVETSNISTGVDKISESMTQNHPAENVEISSFTEVDQITELSTENHPANTRGMEPLAKRRRTISNEAVLLVTEEEGDDGKVTGKEGSSSSLMTENVESNKDNIESEKEAAERTEAEEEEVINKCLEDFVDELNFE